MSENNNVDIIEVHWRCKVCLVENHSREVKIYVDMIGWAELGFNCKECGVERLFDLQENWRARGYK